jgi:hypothetical protein
MARNRKTGGRKGGTPNKRTAEALSQNAIVAQMEANVRNASSPRAEKLAKDVLSEFMHIFAGRAAFHQPLPPGVDQTGRQPNEPKFLEYARLTIDAARALAPYQSPTYKAIQVMAPPGPSEPKLIGNDNRDLDDPVALQRFYQKSLKLVRG